MGDFDRNPTPQTGNQSKQVYMAIGLGVVLIGVLGYHFMKPGPKQAYGGMVASSLAAPVPDETAEQARDALKEDPARNLLTGNPHDDSVFDTLPHNPFVMSPAWRTALVRAPGVLATPTTVEIPTHSTVIPTAVNAERFRLASIIRSDSKLSAILNDHIVSVGAVIDGARVVEIRETGVILQNAQYSDGPTIMLTIDPKRK